MLAAALSLAPSLAFSLTVAQPEVVGGWNASRGANYALIDGASTDLLRADILDLGVTLIGTDELTDAYFESIDAFVLIVITSGGTAITPLTPSEQAALVDFVNGGGVLLAFMDNNTFAGQAGNDAIASVLDPFGLSTTGTINGPPTPATVIDPASTPVTDGPCGLVETYSTYFPGWFDEVGAAETLAQTPAGLPALAWFAPGALGVGSGAAIFFNDASMVGDPFYEEDESNKAVIINSLLIRTPCAPDVNGDGVLNILDFVAFQGLFQAGDAGADCDANGELNVLDFVCYQALFEAGC